MLVLSRRENDRIDFPTLGISVEVLRLTRSRAALGVIAPQGVRVVRSELMGTPEYDAPCQSGDDVLSDELEAATRKIELAHQQLVSGNGEQALKAIAEGLAELDQIRAALSSTADSAEVPPAKSLAADEMAPKQAKRPKLAPLAGFANRSRSEIDTVSEGIPGYRVGNLSSNADDAPDSVPKSIVLLVTSMDAGEDDFASVTSFSGDVRTTDQPMTVLYELSRYTKPDAVLLAPGLDQQARDATVKLIRHCSQHPDVAVVNLDGVDADDQFLSVSSTSV